MRCCVRILRSRVWLSVTLTMAGVAAATDTVPPILSRPVAIAAIPDSNLAVVACEQQPALSLLDVSSGEQQIIDGPWHGLRDVTFVTAVNEILTLGVDPPAVCRLTLTPASEHGPQVTLGASTSLPAEPSRLAVSADGLSWCVTMTWDHTVCVSCESASGETRAEKTRAIACRQWIWTNDCIVIVNVKRERLYS
jgi:hypothetical protein